MINLRKHKYYYFFDVNIMLYVEKDNLFSNWTISCEEPNENGDLNKYIGPEKGTLEYLEMSAFDCLSKFLTIKGITNLKLEIFGKRIFDAVFEPLIDIDEIKYLIVGIFGSTSTMGQRDPKIVRFNDFIIIGVQRFYPLLLNQVNIAIKAENHSELSMILQQCRNIIKDCYKNGLKEACDQIDIEVLKIMEFIVTNSDSIKTGKSKRKRFLEQTKIEAEKDRTEIHFDFQGSKSLLKEIYNFFGPEGIHLFDGLSETQFIELMTKKFIVGDNKIFINFTLSSDRACYFIKHLLIPYFSSPQTLLIEKSKVFIIPSSKSASGKTHIKKDIITKRVKTFIDTLSYPNSNTDIKDYKAIRDKINHLISQYPHP